MSIIPRQTSMKTKSTNHGVAMPKFIEKWDQYIKQSHIIDIKEKLRG